MRHSHASVDGLEGIRVDLVDGIDFSRDGDGIPQRQH